MRLGSDIAERLLNLAAGALRVSAELPSHPSGRHVALQLARAGTGSGANYEEARAAESRSDFIHKVGIDCKAVRETAYWLSDRTRRSAQRGRATRRDPIRLSPHRPRQRPQRLALIRRADPGPPAFRVPHRPSPVARFRHSPSPVARLPVSPSIPISGCRLPVPCCSVHARRPLPVARCPVFDSGREM
jgi:four helix bundle protein